MEDGDGVEVAPWNNAPATRCRGPVFHKDPPKDNDMFEGANVLLAGPSGIAVKIVASIWLLLRLWKFAVTVFSLTTRELERERNRAVLRKLHHYCARKLTEINAPPTIGANVSFLVRMGHWITAGFYCWFVAWFAVEATAVLILGMIRLQRNVWAVLIIVLAIFLYRAGGYFYRQAHELHGALLRSKRNEVASMV